MLRFNYTDGPSLWCSSGTIAPNFGLKSAICDAKSHRHLTAVERENYKASTSIFSNVLNVECVCWGRNRKTDEKKVKFSDEIELAVLCRVAELNSRDVATRTLT